MSYLIDNSLFYQQDKHPYLFNSVIYAYKSIIYNKNLFTKQLIKKGTGFAIYIRSIGILNFFRTFAEVI